MSMEVTLLADAEPRPRKVAIGNFDGVHVGHRAVIAGSDTVLTFDPNPLTVLAPDRAPEEIMPFDLKRDTIASLGVGELVVIPFNREFSRLTADEFVEAILIERLGATEVAVGENFKFGAGATGDAGALSSRTEFTTRVEPLAVVDGEIVSSTRIRELVAAGSIEEAGRCLGAPFTFEGEVVRGDGRGRDLGYPTANLVPPDGGLVPARGIYAALVDGAPAAVSVGLRPTFESEGGLLVEAFLIGQDRDLYGETLRIEFIERLREERKYDDVDELISQMHEDVEMAKASCAAHVRA